MNVIVSWPDSCSLLPRLRHFEGQQSLGLSQLAPVIPESKPEERGKVRQVELGDEVGDLREIEVLSVSQEILDNSNGVLASHLPGLMVEPLVQFRARNKAGLGKNCVQHSWAGNSQNELVQVFGLLGDSINGLPDSFKLFI